MKKLLTILLVVCFCAPVYAGGTMYLKGTDTFIISHGVPDSAGTAYTPADSVEITVMFQDGTESMVATWFNNADAQAVLSNSKLYFFDAWTDMNGTDSLGTYTVTANWYDGSSAALPFEETYTVIQITNNVEATGGTVASFLDQTVSSVDDLVWTVASRTLTVADWTTDSDLAPFAYFDTLIYVGPRGLGVYLDSAAANTNTVLGTDGTSKNPVSTIAAAKTIATALGYNRYYFLNTSTFNDAANDIPSDHQNWEFIGIGQGSELAFGTQRVDGSRFENMDLSGTMHASGGDVLYTNCTLGYITANFNGHAFNCLLADTIVVKADQDIEFVRCQSDVGGNRTPTIDLSGGSSVVQIRAYSGGIRIMNGASNDTMSIETIGQVIISANNTSTNITVRGMLTLTDSGTTTNLTKDAVFSRAEADLWIWANADTAQPDSSELGVWLVNNLGGGASSNWSDAQRDSVLRNMEDRALSLAKFDTAAVAAYYGWGIWLDAAAANTNTTVGVDGTRANPVSTLAAARTLADSMGLQAYYLTNSSSFTLAATYEDWEFIGIGEGSLIDFGNQDVDGSVFDHLMISGTQGGTGMAGLHYCYLNTIDSLEAIVINSSFSDTISVRVSGNTVFDQCYSNVAGNNTPGLDFNSAGTINVSVRHYSGGLALFNMTSTHTISYEAIGQLVIDATCTSANVTARGLMNIADNGTTTALIDTAVINTTQNIGVNWADIDNQTTAVNLTQTLIDTDQKVDLNSSEYLKIWEPANSPLIIEKAAAVTDGSNTTITFKTSLPSPTDNWYNGLQIVFRYDNGTDSIMVVNIVDYNGTTKFVDIRPPLPTAPSTDDSLWVIASRTAVEPLTLANIELALTGAGHAGLDYNNAAGQLDGEDFTSAYYDSIAKYSNPDSLLEVINEIKAMSTLAGVGDSMQVRYIDDDGSDADGLTPATAWTDFTEIQNLTVPTVVLVSEGTYTGVVCSVEVGGISIIGVDGPGITFVRGTTDTVGFATERIFNINPGAEAPFTGFKISGLNIAHRVPNTSDDPGFKNAIFFSDSVANVWIENCVFPDSNYKTIAGNIVTNFNVTGCTFYRNKVHSIDVAGFFGRISENVFFATTDTASIGVYDAIQLTTGAKYMVISHNYGIDQQNFVSLVGADSNLVVGNYSSLSDGHYVSDANAADNVFADNYGENKSLLGLDAGDNQPNTVQEEARDFREQELMNPLPGSIIPNGHLQVAEDDPDSTDPAGWGTNAGTLYLTSRRAFEGYERSLYFGDGSVNTLQMKLDTGYYEMAAQIYFANATTDTAFFQCYNSANEAQNWASSGGNIEYAVGWTGWRRFARLIYLEGDTTFYFSVGANTGDSAYFAEVSLMPYGAVGHTVTASASISDADMAAIADSVWQAGLEEHDGVAGSFGDSAQGWGATGAAPGGSGAFSCSLFAYNSGWAPNGGSPAITSGKVRMISGVNDYTLSIDANGWTVFALDGGTWTAYITALRFLQDTIPQTFTFSADYVDTLTMTAFTPSTPTDTGKVMLYVWTDSTFGATYVGATFRVIPLDKGKNWVTGGGKVLPLGELTKTTDSTGYAEIEVYQSSFTHPYPSGSDSLKYNISITYPGLSSWSQFRFVAPDSGNQYQIGVIE